MSKHVLITGGAGFIGSALVKNFLQKGYSISIIDDLSYGSKDFIDVSSVNFYQENILNRGKVLEIMLLEKPDWVIHLAAVHFIPHCNKYPFESSRINIQGTINVLDAAEQAGVSKVFFASTAAVYPNVSGAIGEETQMEPMDIYGLSKMTGEHLCHQFFLRTGIDVVICRFFNAFGPNETNPHLIPEIQGQINDGNRIIRLGNLDPKRDFIHTFDMARAVGLLMETGIKGIEVFNLGRGIEYSVVEIVDAFERQLGEKITIEVDPEKIRKVERMHLLADVDKLKRYTGWEPEWGIDEGIRTLINEKAT